MTINVVNVESLALRIRLTPDDWRGGFLGMTLLITGVVENTRGRGSFCVAIQLHRYDNILQGINFKCKKIVRLGQVVIELIHHHYHHMFSMEFNFMRYCTAPLRYLSSIGLFLQFQPETSAINNQFNPGQNSPACSFFLHT